MPSLWKAISPPICFPPLEQDATCDLIVVGSGIAGLSCGYEAARCGADVIVIDRGEIAGGMTARTTAHLVSEIDDRYADLIRAMGEEKAGLYHESQVAAVNRIETICSDEGIDADFTRLPGYLIPADVSYVKELESEFDACRQLDVEVEWSSGAPYQMPRGAKTLKFPDQGRFHPLKYCAGLAQAIGRHGGRIYSKTAYIGHDEEKGGVTIKTESGRTIRAGAAMFATNSPVNERVKIHSKQVPMRTYALAGRIPSGTVEDALIWDTLWPYHYVRLHPAGDGQDWLIAGGEDHRSGTANDMDERFSRIEAWTRDHFPTFTTAEYRWSGQVMEPADFVPFSGRDGSDRIYVHTGDSGTGMGNGVAGALNFIALFRNEKARFADLFDPSRKPKSGIAIRKYAKGQGPVAANMVEHITGGEVDSIDEIPRGEGAILRRGAAKHAVYRRDDGSVVELSAKCTHLGCVVHWNSFEKCWDCPCHGSQFQANGAVLNAPAITPLAKAGEGTEGGSREAALHEAK